MREQIIQAIKDIGEKEQDFTIDDRVDMSKYPRMGRKYSGREFNTRTPNISVKYNPTGVIEIYGSGGGNPRNKFIEDWNSGVFKNS
jgi:hypothetical protein